MKEFKNKECEALAPIVEEQATEEREKTEVTQEDLEEYDSMNDIDWESQEIGGVNVVDNMVQQINEYVKGWLDLNENQRADGIAFTIGDLLSDLDINLNTVLDDEEVEMSTDNEWKDWRYYTTMAALSKFEYSGWDIEVNDDNNMSPDDIREFVKNVIGWWSILENVLFINMEPGFIKKKEDSIFNKIMYAITNDIQIVMCPSTEEEDDEDESEECDVDECCCNEGECNKSCTRCVCRKDATTTKKGDDCKPQTESRVANPQKEVVLDNNTAFQRLMSDIFGFKL